MIELLLVALGLGLAGLDPAGALIAAGALGSGAREPHVAAYGLVSLLGTVVLGASLSLTVGPRVAAVDWGALASSPGAAVVEVVLGLGLVAWSVARAWRPATPCIVAVDSSVVRPSASAAGMVVAGAAGRVLVAAALGSSSAGRASGCCSPC